MEWPDPAAGSGRASSVSTATTNPYSFDDDENDDDDEQWFAPKPIFNLPDARRQRRQQQKDSARSVMRQQLTRLEPRLDRYTFGTARNRNGERLVLRFDERDVPLINPETLLSNDGTGAATTVQAVFVLPEVNDPTKVRQTRIPLAGEELRFLFSSDPVSNRMISGRVQQVTYNQMASKRAGTVTLTNLSLAADV